jgi:tRNA dimethylallyltransferase
MSAEKYLIVIIGPTAVGKTALSISLAQQLSCEILSADSRQFYKEMNIGTAKPSAEELRLVKHHFIDTLSIEQHYSAGEFEKDALHVLNQLHLKNNFAVLVGGSGLYINAVCEGFHSLPKDEKIKIELQTTLDNNGLSYLQEILKVKSPEEYKNIDLQNPRRVMRALEIAILSENKFRKIIKESKQTRNFKVIKIGLVEERQKLYERINIRVDNMFANGLFEEAKSLYPSKTKLALQTVGYKEIFDFIDGKQDLLRTKELIKQNTRNFAKRQLTWFRKDNEINWFSPENITAITSHISSKIETISKQ